MFADPPGHGGFHARCAKCADDRCLQIHPGMVIRTMFWADSARGGKPSDKGKGIQCTATDCDVIKAFTLMEVELVCKVGNHLFNILCFWGRVYAINLQQTPHSYPLMSD
jgi:hypothetical protein